MTTLRIDINTQEVNLALGRLIGRLGNLEPMFASIGEYMLRETENRFDDEKDPNGRKWTALSPITLAKKRGRKILTERGFLRGSMNYDPSPISVEIGTNWEYSAIHQFGGKAGRNKKVNIPARPYLGVNSNDESVILQIIEDELNYATS